MNRLVIMALVLGGTATAFGCGGSSKKTKDPSDEATPKDEPPPKWDESSESADNVKHPTFGSGHSTSSDDPSKPSSLPSVPQSKPQQQRRSDEYDKEATEVVLKRAARVVHDNCGSAKDENGKAVGPWGKTQVTVNLGHNGHAKGASVAPEYADKPAGRCMVQAFSNLTFPPWSGGDTTVNWDVELVQPK